MVFAFFGYNESFADEHGLDAFKKNLSEFVQEIRASDSTGKSSRRLVLFSPIAYENLGDPLLPQGDELNRRLLAYTQAMASVAQELDVPYVDLFQPTAELFQRSSVPHTLNGIHLNDVGNRKLAKFVDDALFADADALQDGTLTTIRDAVRDKNFFWFQRYRTTDGYAIFGDRKTTGGSLWTPDNEEVMQREMEVLDAMTANRDQKIWAVAQGKNFTGRRLQHPAPDSGRLE